MSKLLEVYDLNYFGRRGGKKKDVGVKKVTQLPLIKSD